MARLNISKSGCTFTGSQGETVLLNYKDLLSNKSRVSMCCLPEESHLTLPDLLLDLIQKQRQAEEAYTFPFGLIDALLAARLIRSASPVRLLEYGSGQGELSAHLAELLGALHEDSSLVCAYDTIEPAWMERISQVRRLPKLSFLAGDFGALGLQSGSFDIVVINGTAGYEEPFQILRDALSLVKKDGFLLCYTQETPLLESAFKLFFETREEYVLTPASSVLLANAKDCSWSEIESPDFTALARADIEKAQDVLAGGADQGQEIMTLIRNLRKDISSAVGLGDAARKIELLSWKERLIDFTLDAVRGAGR